MRVLFIQCPENNGALGEPATGAQSHAQHLLNTARQFLLCRLEHDGIAQQYCLGWQSLVLLGGLRVQPEVAQPASSVAATLAAGTAITEVSITIEATIRRTVLGHAARGALQCLLALAKRLGIMGEPTPSLVSS
jgi:hypothetical protein